MYKGKGKSSLLFTVILLSGIVIGSFLGTYAAKIPYLTWLSYGKTFGIDPPFVFDLSVLVLRFGLTFDINIAGILGIVIALFIYRKL